MVMSGELGARSAIERVGGNNMRVVVFVVLEGGGMSVMVLLQGRQKDG